MRRFVLAFLLAASAAPAFAALREQPVEWKVGSEVFSGVLVYDDATSAVRPGLVMVPNWMGVTDTAVGRAKDVAGDDYVVLVADLYGKGVRPADSAQALAQVRKVYVDGGTTVRQRVAAAVATLQAQAPAAPVDAARIGAFGFCFGGGAVLELARSGAGIAGVVSVHGDLGTYLPPSATGVRASVLVLNGADDSSVTDAHIAAFEKEMDGLHADWQFVDFSGARHCFSQPESQPADPQDNCRYDERAARRAFQMLRAFFEERFATE
ncbi:dienelactone hydrolase family protein [Agrilutibacter solisilvae]|uniref:Dienelactone hydrolase family protein n=1 Tax=Agrilutibacter solisilvae TaxID=2763317 RepID=A0A974Y0U2_9GAMM|nr:dienelactone hydrolase family protein [Lysobacter solisilvae]QSX78345.1 dienelactone hydrolase family protein [Lysobacter solisilvae]